MPRFGSQITTPFAAAALIACISVSAVHAAEPAKEPLLSGDEIHKLVDAGQYKDALHALARVLQLSGPAAVGYDRNDLLMQKAECQMQTHDNAGALATLQQVQKEAAAANKPNDALMAAAFAELLQKSSAGVFTPRTAATKAAFKIADRTQRKAAYDALFTDDFAIFQLKARAAQSAAKLPPLLDAAKVAGAARAAEFASTGANEQTSAATKDLAERGLKLINGLLDELGSKESRISETASRVITETVQTNNGPSFYSHSRGLTQADQAALNDIIATCQKTPLATTQLGQYFVEQAEEFKAAGAKATELQAKATATLKADYMGVVAPPMGR